MARCRMTDRDIIIIGGGLLGNWCARNLQRNYPTLTTTLIEEGSNLGLPLGQARNIVSRQPFAQVTASTHHRYFASRSGLHHVLGGRSLCWDAVVLPLEEYVLRDPKWPPPVANWLLEYGYPEVLDTLSHHCDPQRLLVGPDQLQLLDNLTMNKIPRAIRPDGQPYTPVLNANEALNPIPGTETILTRKVVGLQADRQSVTAITTSPNGDVNTIIGKKAILAAGTLANGILMAALKRPSHTTVFSGLIDHLVGGVLIAASALKEVGLPSELDYYHHIPSIPANIFLQWQRLEERRYLDLWFMAESLPTPTRFLETNGTDATVNYFLTQDDMAVIERCCRQLSMTLSGFIDRRAQRELPDAQAILNTPHFQDIIQKPQLHAAEIVIPYFCHPGSVHHESSILPLAGIDLDVWGTAREFPNITVVGSALLPRAGCANPTLTDLALATEQCRRVAQD